MPVRKTRRNPKATAQAFEALFFPQLIDLIFASAPRASLLTLRRVCKDWRNRADGQLVRHLAIDYRGRVTTHNGKIPRRNWQRTKIAENVQYIDTSIHDLPTWTKKLPALKGVRHQPSSMWAVTSVYSTSCGVPLPMGEGGVRWASTVAATLAVGTVSECCLVWSPSQQDTLPPTLTVLGIDPPTPRRASRLLWPYALGQALASYLRVAHAYYDLPRLTLVNFPEWLDGLSCGVEGPARVSPMSHDDIRNEIQPYLQTVHPDLVKAMLAAIRFQSLDEYREEVGEERFRFETELVYN
jgi:hypothetical protein